MEVFKPIKVENYHFMDSGLDQYEPLLLYIRDDGKVYFVKNKFDSKLREWVEENLNIQGRNRIIVNRCYGEVNIDVFIQDLEDSIDRLNREVEQLRSQLEERKEKKNSSIYNLIERIGEINDGGL